MAGDIAERSTAERAISEGMARFGRIDTLVNDAGLFISKPFTRYSQDEYAAMLGVNVTGFFHMTQLAIAAMERQGGGHVVQITTTLAEQANVRVPSVLASLTKGGLNAATKSLAIEYAKRGIRVNAVALGVIKSSMHPAETHASARYASSRRAHGRHLRRRRCDPLSGVGRLRDWRDPSCRRRPERRPLKAMQKARKEPPRCGTQSSLQQ